MATPAEILALSVDWKLTLPTGSSHSPTEITQPKLATYSDANFRSAGDHVLFTAKCGGVTTSGSGYPRCELREMRNNGRDKAAWSTTSGSHIMSLDQAFMHLPVAKPHVVASQIHGPDDDITACRLEGSKLYITKGDDTHHALLTSSYVLGTRFTLQWTGRPGGIDYDYNSGAVTGTIGGNYSGCYFKAGCYTQSNPSKGDSRDAYGEVAIYQLVMGPLPPKAARPAEPTPPPDDENPCGG